jgi:hypothetical protein
LDTTDPAPTPVASKEPEKGKGYFGLYLLVGGRVTNLSTGQSVTVRINDRGPFVRGRIVDVSYPAAEKLGLLGRGVARVKLEVETANASLQGHSEPSGPQWPAPDSVASILPH